MRKTLYNLGITTVILLSSAVNTTYADFPNDHIWPIEDTHALSSTFGPRLKASEDFRYDFHRGIDIPTFCNTEVLAVTDGVVRKAGNPSETGYSDRMVQIRHEKADGTQYYSNYMHLAGVAVNQGDIVNQGDVIGFSGESEIGAGTCLNDTDFPESGFDHLHFEIRDEGVLQKNAIHPLQILPYVDNGDSTGTSLAPSVSIINTTMTNSTDLQVDISVNTLPEELDINTLELYVIDTDNAENTNHYSYNIQEWNSLYTPFNSNTNRSDLSLLDNSSFNGITVSPAPFNSNSSSQTIDFTFNIDTTVCLNNISVVVFAKDIWGHYNTDSTYINNTYECTNNSPVEPVEPIDPIEPIEPINPVEPIDPIEPINPSHTPAKPIISTNSTSGGSNGSGDKSNYKNKKRYSSAPITPKIETTSCYIHRSGNFHDSIGHWAENEITAAYQNSIVDGYTSQGLKYFAPDKTINRAEFIKIVLKASCTNISNPTHNIFTDVNPYKWYSKYVQTAKNIGLIDGYNDGTFRPQNEITRAEALKILLHASNEVILDQKRTPYSDTINHWAVRYIATAQSKNYITGYNNGEFKPDRPISRAEAISLINRILVNKKN